NGPAALAHEVQRSRRPCIIQIVFQLILMRETIEAVRRRVLADGGHEQDRVPAPIGTAAQSSGDDIFAILPQYLATGVAIVAVSRGTVHPSAPDRPVATIGRTSSHVRLPGSGPD